MQVLRPSRFYKAKIELTFFILYSFLHFTVIHEHISQVCYSTISFVIMNIL